MLGLLSNEVFSQIKNDSLRDNYWVLGYEYNIIGSISHIFLNFRGDSVQIDSMIVLGSLHMSYTNASICDTAGNLLFFSNGCGVMGAGFQYVPGAEHINDGETQNYLCAEIGGGRYTNTLLILPDTSGTVYNLIHTRVNNLTTVGGASDRLFWTKIVSAPDGQLNAVFADSILLDTFLYTSNMSACRHANGRDWWIVAPAYSNELTTGLDSSYYVLHLAQDSISIHKNSIGVATDKFENSTGEAVFSPDGAKYARYTIHADLQIFDFDRCTGQFSHPVHVPIVDAADTSYAAGLAFSPSGRYLYVSSTRHIYQFDMQAADIPASKTTAATYDGFFYPIPQLPTRFYQCELGPDGKIYVSCPGGKYTFHVIEHPDSAGLACQVVQHKYILDYPIIGGLPHFPNFRLGALSGGCPSVSAVEVVGKEGHLKVYPNPAKSILYVTSNVANRYRVYNMLGVAIMEGQLEEQITVLDISQLQSGVYIMSVDGGLRPVKFIVSH